MKTKNTLPTNEILDQIKIRFYDNQTYPKKYYKDQRMLLYAITWPAKWLEQRALKMNAQKYKQLLSERLDDIVKHGQYQRYTNYFPTYLLKTIQRWFAYNGENLYNQLKHIRNQLSDVQNLVNQCKTHEHQDIVEPIAKAHQVLNYQIHRKQKNSAKQLTLL